MIINFKKFNESLNKQNYLFNTNNIYDIDKILEYRKLLKSGNRLEPAEVYLDDNGDIYIVDGHHRTIASLLESITPNIKETTDENTITGISFMEWEKFEDVLINNQLI